MFNKLASMLFLCCIMLLGCTGTNDSKAVRNEVVTIGTDVGQRAPDFSVETLEGTTYTLAERGDKPAIVFFMAFWCGSCISEAIALAQIQEEYGDAIDIITIDIDSRSTPDDLSKFKAAANNGDFVWAFDASQTVMTAYAVQALDTTLILDADGIVVYRDAFPTGYKALKKALTESGF